MIPVIKYTDIWFSHQFVYKTVCQSSVQCNECNILVTEVITSHLKGLSVE